MKPKARMALGSASTRDCQGRKNLNTGIPVMVDTGVKRGELE